MVLKKMRKAKKSIGCRVADIKFSVCVYSINCSLYTCVEPSWIVSMLFLILIVAAIGVTIVAILLGCLLWCDLRNFD